MGAHVRLPQDSVKPILKARREFFGPMRRGGGTCGRDGGFCRHNRRNAMPLKLLAALLVAPLLGACVAGDNDVVNTPSEIEATLDQDIDGDGTVPQGGFEVPAPE
jgi:hypothetical protein